MSNNLNDKQSEAVSTLDGPLLILAGAGSGKTTVLVNRIANLINHSVMPWNILAITFTNKAANEMKERIENMLGTTESSMWIGTFHSTCSKILRREIECLGYSNDFIIYDDQDKQRLIKDCLKDLNISENDINPKAVSFEISSAKDNLQTPDIYLEINGSDYRLKQIGAVYKEYQKRIKRNNALDFDDLIMLTVQVFSEFPEVLEKYQNKFTHILVDEYQDTNNSQYMFISLLAGRFENICVVGDDDQSIYKFRGANVGNILGFEKDFPGAKVIKLEQNYRSTQTILDAANAVIANNTSRKPKKLWTNNGTGDKIIDFTGETEQYEANYVTSEIKRLNESGVNLSEIAILYRTNSQSRLLEDSFLRSAVPYRVLAGLKFYDRKEIKDTVAYIRIIHNPSDNISLKRIINEPKRGIGGQTIEKAEAIANEKGVSLFEVVADASNYPELSRACAKLNEFTQMIEGIKSKLDLMPLNEFIRYILNESGYLPMLNMDRNTENITRIENIEEFLTTVIQYENTTDNPTMTEFLENISLISDIDTADDETDCVSLLTLHSAKGLEFPYVFIVGMEDGLFPSQRSLDFDEDIEEERRLCYVGITRAKKQLYLTHVRVRSLYATTFRRPPSRFIDEIPDELLDRVVVAEERRPKRDPFMSFGSPGYSSSYDGYSSYSDPFTDTPRSSASDKGFDKYTSSTDLFKQFDVRNKTVALDYAPGDVVYHKKFGRGVVVSINPLGNDAKVEINFDSAGIKNLMASFANLKKDV